MPSGTELNRPTDATGQIRNNTNETSSGSASAMEYYNGTEWKVISCIGLPMAYLVVAGGGSSQLAGADGPAGEVQVGFVLLMVLHQVEVHLPKAI